MLFRDIFDLDNFPIAGFKPQAMRLPIGDQGKAVHLTIEGQITIRGTTKATSAATDCRLDGITLTCARSTVVDAREFRVLVPGADSPIQVNPMITIEFSDAVLRPRGHIDVSGRFKLRPMPTTRSGTSTTLAARAAVIVGIKDQPVGLTWRGEGKRFRRA